MMSDNIAGFKCPLQPEYRGSVDYTLLRCGANHPDIGFEIACPWAGSASESAQQSGWEMKFDGKID